MKLQDWHARQLERDPEYAEAVAYLDARRRFAREHPGLRLHVADWLGVHLPLRWIPFEPLNRFVNNGLARSMWATPGFDVAERCTCSGFLHDKDCPEFGPRVATGKGDGT